MAALSSAVTLLLRPAGDSVGTREADAWVGVGAEPAREQTQQQPRDCGHTPEGPLSPGGWAAWPGQEGLESRGCGSRAWQAAVWLLKGQPVCSSGRELPSPRWWHLRA